MTKRRRAWYLLPLCPLLLDALGGDGMEWFIVAAFSYSRLVEQMLQ
jgi:hypothetical protein